MNRFKECRTCYFRDRSPEICEDCDGADQYEPEDSAPDEEGIQRLRRITFIKRQQEIVNDIEEGFPDWWKL